MSHGFHDMHIFLNDLNVSFSNILIFEVMAAKKSYFSIPTIRKIYYNKS